MSQRLTEATGVCLLGFTAMLVLSLVSYDAADPSWFNVSSEATVTNLVGQPGAFVAALLLHTLGLASFVPVVCLAVISMRLILSTTRPHKIPEAVGLLIMVAAMAALLDMTLDRVVLGGETAAAGGLLGAELSRQLRSFLNTAGATIVLLTVGTVGVLLFTQLSAGRAVRAVKWFLAMTWTKVRIRTVRMFGNYRRERTRREVIRRHAEEVREEVERSKREVPPPEPEALKEAAEAVAQASGAEPGAGQGRRGNKARRRRAIRDRVRGFMDARDREDGPEVVPRGKSDAGRPQEVGVVAEQQLPLPVPEVDQDGPVRPPLSLLRTPEGELDVDEKELFERGKALEAKFKEFSVSGSVLQIHPGPVVTTYEFKPAPGVKYSRLTSLADDLCLALKAESIRIDRLAGKSTVGIEVPNPKRETIFLREILMSEAWKNSSSPLTIALGKLINGEPYVSDLARMPHLLIAGATGAGKSVSLHSMIASILFRSTPDEVRFVMIDPKTLELAAYDGIPHLLCPVVTDPKLAANALRWATREMESRYKMLARYGVRSIDQFNAILRTAAKEGKPTPTPHGGAEAAEGEEVRPLPYIVVVIDELADLMMVSSTDVEEAITRLAQMARAVGIHLILATQRPSVDVITGVIKANFPSRISFRVASRTDSRTILDSNGAEQLLGKGDMLFLPPGGSRLVRVHGPFISEKEADAVASYLKKRAKPVYHEEVTKPEETDAAGRGGSPADDEAYREAVKLVVRTGQASVSNLQRKMRLGYSRAARLVDMMEEDGIVSKADGARPRQVLMSPKEFDIRFGAVSE